MKNLRFSTLKHRLSWLLVLTALLGVSQCVWGATVRGSFNSWTNVTLVNGSCTISINSGNYEFGVDVGSFYKGGSITRASNSASLNTSGNNTTINADVTGDYVFTWDEVNHTITVTYPMPTLYLRGIDTWNTKDNQMSESNGVYTITKSLTAGRDYSFKVADANYNPYNYGKDSKNYETCGDEYVMGTNGDLSYRATITGDHVFTFTLSSKTLEITCPSSCDPPSSSNFTITGSLEQTLSGLTAISASSNTQGYNPSIEVQYNGSSSLPVATGAYPVTLVVGANGDYCASTVAVGTLNVYEVIVKAKKANIDGWGNDVYLHYWGTCNPGSDWANCPKMNYDGSEWYTLGLNCTPDNILFKNATGNNPGKQSVDKSFSPDDCYEVLNEMDNNKYKVKEYENCQLCTAPSVVTNNTPENVTGTTATLKCTVTEAGDCQNPEIGIAYGTSEHPTSGTEGTVSGGVCSVNLTNLVAGKYYYYRAYTTVGGTTTYGEEYGFYTKPANIYIKGLIIHSGNGCPDPWPTDNTAFSKNADGTVFTKTITARKPNCSYNNVNSDAEFVLMSSTDEADKLNVKGTFNPDGQNSNWIRSKRSGDHDESYNFKYSAEYNAGDQLTITVTFMSDGTFKMKASPACDTEVQKKNISIASSAICSGSSVNVTVASSQSGVTYTVYDAANNEVGTGTGNGGDLNISVSPSASTTFTVKGSQGAACESTTMNNTVDVTVWNAPKYSPTSNITAYLPITITGTAGSSWSITSPSPAGNAWLSNTSGLTTVFKAPAGTYTVQDSNTSCATNSVTITVAADSETCQ